MLKSLTLAAVMVLGSLSLAHAADTTATAPVKQMRQHHRMMNNSPCAPVFEACQKAGYNQGGMKDGKGLIANCVKPLDEGKSVAGVTIDKAKVEACKAHHVARKAEFDQKMKNDPEFAKKVQERKARWEARMNAAKAKAAPVAVPTAPAAH
ncbi:MAG TPA: hypothetical protein VGF14_01835 [Alphaproteobacteria bacterium]